MLSSTATGNDQSFNVDKTKSFVIGSWMSNPTSTTANAENTLDTVVTSDTRVDIARETGNGTIDWSGFVVETTDGTTVEHGTIVGQGATSDQDVTLATAVSLTRSMAMFPGNMGSTVHGTFTGTAGIDVRDAQVQLTLEDTGGPATFDNLNVRHSTDGAETGQDISWHVIEWGTGGAAPAPRIMVT